MSSSVASDNALPLAGIKVVDFGQPVAGAAVAMILADLGATVVHIARPANCTKREIMADSPMNATLNRNKLIVNLDLKTDSGVEKALALIRKADCVIDSFRPGVLKRLGIDYERLRVEQPALVALSIPGFPSTDPVRCEWKATEAVILATAGAFTDMGFNRVLMGLNPSFSPLVLGSAYTASMAATSVVLALYSRLQTGVGDYIEVPIVAACMEGLSYNSIVVDGYPERYKCMREKEIAKRRAEGTPLDIEYKDLKNYLDPFYRTYECSDGRMMYLVAPSHPGHVTRALKLLGLYDELVADGFPVIPAEGQHIISSELPSPLGVLGMYPLCKEWAEKLAPRMEEAFLRKTGAEWGELFGQHAVPATMHRTTEEWVQCPHNNAAGLIVPVAGDPEFGDMQQPGPAVWLDECSKHMLHPKPRRYLSFEDAVSVFNTTHVSPSSSSSSSAAAAAISPSDNKDNLWLNGVRIIDLTNVIAGPHSCAYLGRFGAEVIKLEPVSPTFEPLVATAFTFLTDIGKKKVLLDIRSGKGKEAFHRLLKTADIVVINAVDRQLAPLGLDEKTLKAVNSNLIFCQLNAFGGPNSPITPRCEYIGYDDVVQSFSGIMSRFGGKDTPEEHAHLGTLDVNCGFLAGLSMAVALYHRRRTGVAGHPHTSLSATSNLVQIPFNYYFEGRGPYNEPSGRESLGYSAWSYFYKCKDDTWVYMDSNKGEMDKLHRVFAGLDSVVEDDEHSLAVFFRQAFLQQTAEEILFKLRAEDIAAASPLSISDIRDKHTRAADGTAGTQLPGSFAFSHYADHPGGRAITRVDHYAIRPSVARISAQFPAQVHGHSTIEVLKTLGYTSEEIDDMIAQKFAATTWGPFLPE